MSDNSSPPSAAQVVEIDAEQAGQRLDNFLIAKLKGVPRSRLYRIVRGGEVRVNSARRKPDYRLQVGDRVRLPPLRLAPQAQPAAAGQGMRRLLAQRVLYEDGALLVIDKPSGLAVHGGSGVSSGLIETLRAMRPDCASLELVHRLDRETSGCIMVAKKRSMLRHLHAALRDGAVDKRYRVLVRGRWPRRRTRVVAPLERGSTKSGERIVRADAGGKPAETRFALVEHFGDASLLEANPLTGRTHQIRVHALHAGHPVAGDDKYGDREFNRGLRAFGLSRLFLHAFSLEFDLPDGRRLALQAPLATELNSVLDRLRREGGS